MKKLRVIRMNGNYIYLFYCSDNVYEIKME